MRGDTKTRPRSLANPKCRHFWRRKWVVRLTRNATLTGIYCKKCGRRWWPKCHLERFRRRMK